MVKYHISLQVDLKVYIVHKYVIHMESVYLTW